MARRENVPGWVKRGQERYAARNDRRSQVAGGEQPPGWVRRGQEISENQGGDSPISHHDPESVENMSDDELQATIRQNSEALAEAQFEELQARELSNVGAEGHPVEEPRRPSLYQELQKRGIKTKGRHW